jgi:hypothetical protein
VLLGDLCEDLCCLDSGPLMVMSLQRREERMSSRGERQEEGREVKEGEGEGESEEGVILLVWIEKPPRDQWIMNKRLQNSNQTLSILSHDLHDSLTDHTESSFNS